MWLPDIQVSKECGGCDGGGVYWVHDDKYAYDCCDDGGDAGSGDDDIFIMIYTNLLFFSSSYIILVIAVSFNQVSS